MKSLFILVSILSSFLLNSPLLAQSDLKPLGSNEGYVVLHVNLRNGIPRAVVLDRIGAIGGGYTMEDLEEDNFKVIKLKAGTYTWQRVRRFGYDGYYEIADLEYSFDVEPNKINYGGTLLLEYFNNLQSSYFRNRSSNALAQLQNCCGDLLDRYEFAYQGDTRDPYPKMILSLQEAAKPSAEQKEEQTYKELSTVAYVEMTERKDFVADLARKFFIAQGASFVTISAKGTSIAYIEHFGAEKQLVLIRTNPLERRVIGKFTSFDDITQVYWIDDETLALGNVAHAKRTLHLFTFDYSQPSGRIVKRNLSLDHAFLFSPLTHLHGEFVFGRWSSRKLSHYRANLDKHTWNKPLYDSRNLVNQNRPKSSYYLSDHNGKLIAGFGHDEKTDTNSIWLQTGRKKRWEVFKSVDTDTTLKPVLVDEDNQRVYVLTNENREFTALEVFNSVDGTSIEVAAELDGSDIDDVIISPDGKSILGVTYIENGIARFDYFRKLDQSLTDALALSVEESNPYIVDYDLSRDKMIVVTSSSTDPGSYHLFDIESNELIKFVNWAPELEGFEFRKSEVITSKSIDGLPIESYLSLPVNTGEVLPPLIVMPHGGPIAVRDTREFDREAQLLNTLGYAVLKTNYRGSQGFGKSFVSEGYGQWGRLIEADVNSAVEKAIELQFVDPDQICIYGASYGGYSALISTINDPDRYKCGASLVGVTDLPLLVGNSKMSSFPTLESIMKRIVGDPETEMEALSANSPVYQAHRLERPVFLAQGAQDKKVDLEHHSRMSQVLDTLGLEYDSLIFEEEGHGLEKVDNLVTFYSRLDKFFQQHIRTR